MNPTPTPTSSAVDHRPSPGETPRDLRACFALIGSDVELRTGDGFVAIVNVADAGMPYGALRVRVAQNGPGRWVDAARVRVPIVAAPNVPVGGAS